MMLFCVVLVSVLGRDFGPMLTAERNATPAPPHEGRVDEEQPTVMKANSLNDTGESSEDSYSGEYNTHLLRSGCHVVYSFRGSTTALVNLFFLSCILDHWVFSFSPACERACYLDPCTQCCSPVMQ